MDMREILLDTATDSVRLVPFLFVTYLLMEWLEHKTGKVARQAVQKSGRLGPLFGAVAGAFPQCGFSAAGSSLYAGRVITLGTLFSIYLSTSDEMLPILISEAAPMALIGRILLCKIVIGLCVGLSVDLLLRRRGEEKKRRLLRGISESDGHSHCGCGKGILRSAASHTLQVFFFIFLVSLCLNLLLEQIGGDALAGLFIQYPVVGELTAGLIGLIPNCASSVVLTQLYLKGALSFGALLSGLLTGSGIGLLVLYRVNHHWKENVCITASLYLVGVICGIMVSTVGM